MLLSKSDTIHVPLLSKAIEIAPTAEIFLARAEAFRKFQLADRMNSSWWNWGEIALKDLADAIILSNSSEIEIKARKLRQEFGGFAFSNYTVEQRDEDFEFEKQSRTGIERGRWIYQKVSNWDPFFVATDYTISLLQEALESGYREPDVYFLLAKAYHGACNYGLALREIDQLIKSVDANCDNEKMVDYLCVRAKILVEMKKYEDADKALAKAQKISTSFLDQFLVSNSLNLEEDVLIRLLIDIKYGGKISRPIYDIANLLIYSFDRNLFDLVTSLDDKKVLELKTRLDFLEKKHPEIFMYSKKLISAENWLALKSKESLLLKFDFLSIAELVKEMQKNNASIIQDDKKQYLSFVSKG